MLKLIAAAGLLLVGLTLLLPTAKDSKVAVLGNRTVAILALSKTSGGTGVIYQSSGTGTQILTNKHVCQLIQVGGLVQDEKGSEYPVQSFRVYSKHDLCMVTVDADLHNSVKLADKAPLIFDELTVSGHPTLLPTIITTGHFSHLQDISVVVDMEKCDGKEIGQEMIICMMMGGKPVVKELHAQATSALIQPGSSGSAVYNAKGELAGLVFAGAGEIGFGFIVPYAYVKDFLTHQADYKSQTPDANAAPKGFFQFYSKYKEVCASHKELNKVCNTSSLGIKYEQNN